MSIIPRHTPGPWSSKVSIDASGTRSIAIHAARVAFDPTRAHVATVTEAGRSTEELMANASMLAAAPTLHAALEAILDLLETQPLGRERSEKVKRIALDALQTTWPY